MFGFFSGLIFRASRFCLVVLRSGNFWVPEDIFYNGKKWIWIAGLFFKGSLF